MSRNYTIPELLSIIGIRGYIPQAAVAINKAMQAKSELDYSQSIRKATELIVGIEAHDYGKSSFFEGIPLWLPLLLQHDDIGELLLENAIVDLTRTKNIVTTAVQGLDGTIKEYISNGDWQISVRGILAQKQYGYPKEQYQQLLKFMQLNKPINVANQWLNDAEIYSIVITDFKLPYNPHINCIIYEFNALSDKPVELKINDDV
ncbi:MAG: hypothetical protein HPY79_11860 [Bacteroidales bacterium]|nr:hypothetical protein [Bacteroidales bacterium]